MSEPLLSNSEDSESEDQQPRLKSLIVPVSTPTPRRRITWEDQKTGHSPARYDSSESDMSPERSNQTETETKDNRRRPKLRALDPRRYNGKGPIDEYLLQFEVIAKHNQWDKFEQAAALLGTLEGSACSIIHEFNDATRITYKEVKEALLRRFGATKRTEIHEQALNEMRIKKDDDIRQAAQEIVKLSKRAYPELTASQRERFAIKAMISAIDDPDTTFYIRDKEPKTINDVCELFEKYEALSRGHRKQRSANVRSTSDQTGYMDKWMKETDDKFQRLTEAITTLINRETEKANACSKQPETAQPSKVSNNIPKKPCPRCGGPHWARACPNNVNCPTSTTACFQCGGEGHQWRHCLGNFNRPTSAPDRWSPAVQGQ
jgi:hypothetical protein